MSKNETAEAIIIVLKKIGKWILYGLLIVISIVILYSSSIAIVQYYENKPKLITELKNIKIGERYSDFMFKNPGYIVDKNPPKNRENESYLENSKEKITVAIKGNLISEITYICKENYENTTVNGISCNETGDYISDKFGENLRIQCLKDKTDKDYLIYRVYDVVKYGVRHHVLSNKVVAFNIVNPDILKDYTGLNWSNCE